MGGDSKHEFRAAIQPRYLEASREEKGLILREFYAVCKYHRKYAIRLLNQRKRGPTKRPGRKPVYHSAELVKALKRIWLATDQMCSKRLVAAIPLPMMKKTRSENNTNHLTPSFSNDKLRDN